MTPRQSMGLIHTIRVKQNSDEVERQTVTTGDASHEMDVTLDRDRGPHGMLSIYQCILQQ